MKQWSLDNRITVVLFAGMGGGCDGMEQAGFPVNVAINHDPVAVAVHKMRHPHTEHLTCDIFEADPREVAKGRGIRALHASPDCTFFSVAKGGKPVSKRRRSLVWVVCRWAGAGMRHGIDMSPEVITLENVSEIQNWGPLVAKRCKTTGRAMRIDGTVAAKGERIPVEEQWLVPDPRHKGRTWRHWIRHLEGLGYKFEGKVLCCADYGVPTIRTRYFGVARRDGAQIVWPERSHAPRKDAKALGLAPWVGAHTIIDWSIPVKSIFDRPRPLADATLRRVARGVMRYVINAARPFIVPITHTGAPRVHDIDEPLRTLTTANRGELSVVVPHVTKFRTGSNGADVEEPLATVTANSFRKRPGGAIPLGIVEANLSPFIADTAHGEGQGRGVSEWDINEPIRTISASSGKAVAAATLTRHFGNSDAADVEDPVGAIVAGGSGKTALVAAFMAQHNNDARRDGGVHPGKDATDPIATITLTPQVGIVAATMADLHGTRKDGRDIAEPVATISASGNHAGVILAFLQQYYSQGGQDQDLNNPLTALTAKARHGLVTVMVRGKEVALSDIGMRMLQPEEGAAAHGFAKGSLPDQITIDGVTRRLTKTEKYHLVGNSVPPLMVQLLAEANVVPELMVAAE